MVVLFIIYYVFEISAVVVGVIYEFVLLDDTYVSVTIITDSIHITIKNRMNHSFESDDEVLLTSSTCFVLDTVGCCEFDGIDNIVL